MVKRSEVMAALGLFLRCRDMVGIRWLLSLMLFELVIITGRMVLLMTK